MIDLGRAAYRQVLESSREFLSFDASARFVRRYNSLTTNARDSGARVRRHSFHSTGPDEQGQIATRESERIELGMGTGAKLTLNLDDEPIMLRRV
ncbi:MAG: hypothetical protein IT285_06490 [Bdellovibrionales bacterium]|nr:hypothetical protein [Bdellovibrionales bacterium]